MIKKRGGRVAEDFFCNMPSFCDSRNAMLKEYADFGGCGYGKGCPVLKTELVRKFSDSKTQPEAHVAMLHFCAIIQNMQGRVFEEVV